MLSRLHCNVVPVVTSSVTILLRLVLRVSCYLANALGRLHIKNQYIVCFRSQAGAMQRCPLDPYHMVPDKCTCVDFQTLKLQENPEDVPHGEMPRHMQLYVDRYLTDRVTPGNRVCITGVLSIKKMFNKVG